MVFKLNREGFVSDNLQGLRRLPLLCATRNNLRVVNGVALAQVVPTGGAVPSRDRDSLTKWYVDGEMHFALRQFAASATGAISTLYTFARNISIFERRTHIHE